MQVMKRKTYDELVYWKNKSDRMPLIVNGARQVGKNYLRRDSGLRTSLEFAEIFL